MDNTDLIFDDSGDLEEDEKQNLHDLVEEFEEQEKTTRTDGSVGVKNLCRLVRALGYKDWQHYGQFHPQGAHGDLFAFLEDNQGCIEAIKEWIVDQDLPEWREEITSHLNYKEECDGEDLSEEK